MLVYLVWFGALAGGLSASLAVYAVATWGRPTTVRARTARIREWVRADEPLLPQLWRFLSVIASGRTVTAVAGSFSAFERSKVEVLLEDARHPWGFTKAGDVYAVGLSSGVILTLSAWYLSGLNLVALVAFPAFLMAGLGIPVIALKIVASGTRQAMVRELWTLMSGLEVYLASGYPLYYALKEATATCVLISPAIDRALLQWGSAGPGAALDQLGKELRLPEAFLVIGAIRQAVDADPSSLATFMMRESIRLDKAMEANQARSAQVKPMLQNAALFIPMFNIFILWTAPWAYSVFAQLERGVQTAP